MNPNQTTDYPDPGEQLARLAAWAQSETTAATLGEAVALAQQRPEPTPGWRTLKSTSLTHLAPAPEHPYIILRQWISQLPERHQVIFQARIAGPGPERTLEAIGAELGITREGVRQLSLRINTKFDRFLNQKEAEPIRWRVYTIRTEFGPAIPADQAELLLQSPEDVPDYRRILLALAGPYRPENDWLVLERATTTDPTRTIIEQADTVGRIDQESATRLLNDWGLREHLHIPWLTRNGIVRQFNDRLVRWGRSIPERMAFALADLDRPATIEEMTRHVGEKTARSSIANAISNSPDIVRVDRRHWSLASWDQPVYTTIAQSIGEYLRKHQDPVPIHRIVRHMADNFDVKENTTKSYLTTPMFVVENEKARLRNHLEEPFQYEHDYLRNTPGVFHLGQGRVARVITVDADFQRGSGTILTHAVGSILNLRVNEELTFSTQHDEQVRLTFPDTSVSGPLMGSIRAIVQRLCARSGDILTLIFNATDRSLETSLIPFEQIQSGWDTIALLTGIPQPANPCRLAAVLHCSTGEIHSTLRSRGDLTILKAMPRPGITPSLQRALEGLASQITQ